MGRLSGALALLMAMLALSSCGSVAAVDAQPARTPAPVLAPRLNSVPVDPNLAALARKFKASGRSPISIVQFGDSHTAADLFSGELRRLLQAQYGDGGIGFIAATPVSGTRYDNVILTADKHQWTLLSARNQQSEQFPLGGYLSVPAAPAPRLRLEAREPSPQRYRISALYQADSNGSLEALSGSARTSRMLPATAGQWRFSSPFTNMALPVELVVSGNRGVVLGGWNIQSLKNTGVTYSALGINGAKLEVMDKWQSGWTDTLKVLRPDMVVLAYGTNEAFDDGLDLTRYEAQLRDKLSVLRQALPKAVILIVGAPDSIKHRNARSCEQRQPQPLRQVIQIQKRVAQQTNALFWDWQAYMGGNCSIVQWQAQGLARGDLIHLSAEGYRKSAAGLYAYLREQLLPGATR